MFSVSVLRVLSIWLRNIWVVENYDGGFFLKNIFEAKFVRIKQSVFKFSIFHFQISKTIRAIVIFNDSFVVWCAASTLFLNNILVVFLYIESSCFFFEKKRNKKPKFCFILKTEKSGSDFISAQSLSKRTQNLN